MIVLMAGLPGTGKSALARELARLMNGRVLSKDEFRHAIFLPEEIEYSTAQDDFCLELMLHTVRYLVSRDPKRVIFLDGRPFSRRHQIDNVLAVAAALHQPWKILECICADETVRRRLASDAASQEHRAENRDYALYLRVKERFEAITLPKIVIDTDRTLEECMSPTVAALRA